MKRIILVFLLISAALGMKAQKLVSGSFESIKNAKYIRITWDFSHTVFEEKYTESDWEKIVGVKEWDNAKAEAMEVIIANLSDKARKTALIFKSAGNGDYILTIAPANLDRKGNNVSNWILFDNEGKELGSLKVKGDGGHWGDLANLLGDGYEEAARSVGKYISKVFKK